MDQFYELRRTTILSTTGVFGYISVSGLSEPPYYTFDLRDSLFNNIPYTSAYISGEYQLTPTGLLADSGVTFSVLYNGVVAAKITTRCPIVSGCSILVR